MIKIRLQSYRRITDNILNLFSISLRRICHDFNSGTKYANLYSFCSCIIQFHSRATVMKQKFTSPLDILCRHLCLSLMLKLFSIIDLAKQAEVDYDCIAFSLSCISGELKLVLESTWKCFDTPKSALSLKPTYRLFVSIDIFITL